MKVIFDTEACKKNNKDVDLLLYLISLYAGSKITVNTFEKARQQSFLRFNSLYRREEPFPEYVDLSDSGEFLVETIIAGSDLQKDRGEESMRELADKLRALFPAGNKPGYKYAWRDSTSCISDRLTKFFLKYPECKKFTDDDIVDATKRYISDFNGDYRYMQLLKYFIWKDKMTGEELVRGRIVGEKEMQSQLANYLLNKEDETTTQKEWDSELK